MLDPRTHAVRPDLADIRLADRVFAPHYAAPRVMQAVRAAALREQAGDEIGEIGAGDTFEALELTATSAWGIAPRLGLVGYVDADALGPLA